jgi:predicted dehydrogenase
MGKIGIAVIGCGNIAKNAHIPAYMNNPEAEIKYFCDIIPERAQGHGGKIRLWNCGGGLSSNS